MTPSCWRPFCRKPRPAAKRLRLRLEALEDRLVPASFTVNNLNDSGGFSLRDAITQANASTDSFKGITLEVSGTITLNSPLPALTAGDWYLQTGPLAGAKTLTVARSQAAGTPAFSVFSVAPGATVSMRGLTISGGLAPYGGGIYNQGLLTLQDCLVTGNAATKSGGGIYSGPAGAPDSQVSLSVTYSAVINNTTSGTGGAAGIDHETGALDLDTCTVSGNRSTGGSNAGGILVNGGSAFLRESTVANNTATGAVNAGGLDVSPTLTPAVNNTILAKNSSGSASPDGRFNGTSTGSSLIGNGTGVVGITNGKNGNLVGTAAARLDPRLGPLQDNGGPTPTMALLAGSPAIGAGSLSNHPYLPADQRGYARTLKGASDIGAYESGSKLLAVGPPGVYIPGQSPSSVPANTAITLGAIVDVAVFGSASSYPSGSVDFTVDGKDVGSASLNGGSATLALPGGLAPGQHTVTVTYEGNGTFAGGSSSGAIVLTAVGSTTPPTTPPPSSPAPSNPAPAGDAAPDPVLPVFPVGPPAKRHHRHAAAHHAHAPAHHGHGRHHGIAARHAAADAVFGGA